jgi:hypothetical protein
MAQRAALERWEAGELERRATLTRERFGWEPTHPSLLDDLRAGGYPSAS